MDGDVGASRIVATGLRAPEGPVCLPGGDIAVCEMAANRVSRISADGSVSTIGSTNGSPNGAALGPDGALYICNRGRTHWREVGDMLLPVHGAEDLRGGGAIDWMDIATGETRTLYSSCDGFELNGPNDIAFDHTGGFWFTDFGHLRKRDRDVGSVFYARADGSAIKLAATGLEGPNGIALSPDGATLYVSETFTNFLWAFDLEAPGIIRPSPTPLASHGGRFVASPAGFGYFDSLAVDASGNVIVARVMAGGLCVIDPQRPGDIGFVSVPEPAPTNLCFGGADRRIAYVTLFTSGRLMALDWPRPGAALAYDLRGEAD